MEKRQQQTVLKNKGFSLAELMVVVAIIGIMAAIATPAIMSWLPNMRLTAGARDLYSTLQKAKLEAARRNQICVVVFNQNIGGTNFAYVLFEDLNGNIQYDVPPLPALPDPIILRVQQLPQSISFDTSQGGGDGLSFPNNGVGNPAIGFRPTTLPVGNGGVISNGTAWLKNPNRSRRIIVNRAGSISIK